MNSRVFNWLKIDHALVRERSSFIRKEMNALLAKGPTRDEQERIVALAEQLFDTYSEVCALQGFPTTPALISTVYGKIASQMEVRIGSVIAELQRKDVARGGLTNSTARKAALKLAQGHLRSRLAQKADIRTRELSYQEASTPAGHPLRQPIDGLRSILDFEKSDKAVETSNVIDPKPPTAKPSKALSSSVITLRFKRLDKRVVALPCGERKTAIANTFDRLVPLIEQVKTMVRCKDEITVRELRRSFRNNRLGKALDESDWQLCIEEFMTRRPAGVQNFTIALLARKTGLSFQTIATYVKPSKRNKKTLPEIGKSPTIPTRPFRSF